MSDKPPVKRKIRCRLNLARSARAAMSASHPNGNGPKANQMDSAVSQRLSRRPDDKAMEELAQAKLREFKLGDPVRFCSPFSPTTFQGEVVALNGRSS
jgi:hypothetical protein